MSVPAKETALVASDIKAYLEKHAQKTLLRFITCGSVDDGKSTLIGRLLYDSKMLYEDQLETLEGESKRLGTQGEGIDFALLVDGLAAEREQGITIDVAYRFFSTDKRKFIVADTPGHVQYTRNMATGASTADLAILLVDARAGLMPQTLRHAYICNLLGIRHIVLAVNKMDLIDYSEAKYMAILDDFARFAGKLNFSTIQPIPISALGGDNIITPSNALQFYDGPPLLSYLETVDITSAKESAFRLPVQWVNRPNLDFRGFAGNIANGQIAVGDAIIVIPSGRRSIIKSILKANQDDTKTACKGEAISLCLEDEIDISRGDIICGSENPCAQTDQFSADIIWMADTPLLMGRQYLMKLGNSWVKAVVTELRHKIDIESFDQRPAKSLSLNEIGVCKFKLSKPVAFDPYTNVRETGAFILVDQQNFATLGAGMVAHALSRAENVVWQELEIDKAARSKQKQQKSALIWFTGLSGAGKSTIANLVEKRLFDLGRHTYILDGDNLRHGLNKDLGFTDAGRVENIRRVAEVSKLIVDAGLIVLSAFISPFREERAMARDLFDAGEFIEVYVDTPLEVAEKRDVKGLYKKARAGKIKNFTGIDSAYEPPPNPELRINTIDSDPKKAADIIVNYLIEHGYF